MAAITRSEGVNPPLDIQSLRSRSSTTSSSMKEASMEVTALGASILSYDIETCKQTILNTILGNIAPFSSLPDPHAEFYLRLLQQRVRKLANSALAQAIFRVHPGTTFTDLLRGGSIELTLFQILVIIAKSLETGTATIHAIMEQLIGLVECQPTELSQLVFKGISMITLLFDAEETPCPSTPARFRMVLLASSQSRPSQRHQQSSVWRRLTCPITTENGGSIHIDLDQLLSHFGQCVPTPCVAPPGKGRDFYEDTIVASNLNYNIISKIGALKIEWVESLSLHLDLHERTAVLRLFAYPSFCALLCRQFDKQETFLSKIVFNRKTGAIGHHSYEYASQEHAYSYDFLVEVLCSYRLVFGQHKQSYTQFSSIPTLEVVDPLLKKLCGASCKKHDFYSAFEVGEPKTMYTASADFPLLGQRLLKLQSYMNERNPSDLKTLWYDKRDILRYYTFWAVVWVGSLSILISLLSLAFTIMQVKEGIATINARA